MEAGDFQKIVDQTHPVIIAMAGGETQLLAFIQNATETMKDNGVTFEKVEIGEVGDCATAGSEIHCLVGQTIFLKTPEGKLKAESSLIAITKDNGVTLFFVDTPNLTNENVRTVFPDYNPKLVIPAKKQPEMIKEE